MNRVLLIALLLIGGFQSSELAAEDVGRVMMVFGTGNDSCGEWSSYKTNADQRVADSFWLLGYVSAAGVYADKQFVAPDKEALRSWVDNYCQQNPLDSVFNTAIKLVAELQKRFSNE